MTIDWIVVMAESIPETRMFTQSDLWVERSPDGARVGITEFAQGQLGDIVYVELPDRGARPIADQSFGVVESSKTASDLIAPVSGTVLKVNKALDQRPTLLNEDPYGEGWLLVMSVSSDDEWSALLPASAYEKLRA